MGLKVEQIEVILKTGVLIEVHKNFSAALVRISINNNSKRKILISAHDIFRIS